ncbi:MAG TPA: gamma-glutamyl-phosphate reductase, partial [Pirellulales bacterium]|nr:gamma-glutamyl-phosphate reductase [Pirellulales bacterium]
MAVADQTDLDAYCLDLAQRAKRAAAHLGQASGAQKAAWLAEAARLLRQREPELLAANALDLEAAGDYGLTDAQIDR